MRTYQHTAILLAALLPLITSPLGCGGDPRDRGKTEEAEVKTVEHPIGEAFQGERAQVTIAKIETHAQVGSDAHAVYQSKAKDGSIFVCVQYSVHNNGQEPLARAFAASVLLRDAKGAVSDPHVKASTNYTVQAFPPSGDQKKPRFNREIEPGATAQQATVFEVAKADWEAGGWHIVVDENHVLPAA